MLTLNHTQDAEAIEYRMFSYILNCIDVEAYDYETEEPSEKLRILLDTFKSEFCHPYEIKRHRGDFTSIFAEYIAGLPSIFGVDFENYRILEIGEEVGMLDNPTEEQEDEFISDFFRLVAYFTLQLMELNGMNPRKEILQ
jgi:hypothetical protein